MPLSAPNKETIDDNKSSETLHSGRHLDNHNYHNILRPRGIDI